MTESSRPARVPIRERAFGSALAVFLCCLSAGCQVPRGAEVAPPRTVARVDPSRYMGTWYDIAHYPFKYQRGCAGTTATYRLREDGRIEILNECRKGKKGKPAQARGVAWAVDDTYAKLKVRFFWPFTGDYWIIGLGKNYEYAVVGHPKRKYLWILSRTPILENELFAAILDEVRAKGYDPSRIVRTPQP